MVALYARQSIDKKDSISIETQLEYGKNICKLENLEYKEYFDKGFSGSNLDRPKFKELLKDIESGKINKVVCYRLDRISRSLVDFSNLLVLFQKYNVEFVSATEQFDTSTPIGRAMINIIMVFAQLERETIQQRITDNYYARAKNGSFAGGNIPLGYTNKKILINNKKVSVLEQDREQIQYVKEIFELYIQNKTIRNIASYFSKKLNKLITDKYIKRILMNPIYVKSDVKIYNYFKNKGYIIHNKIDEFDGTHGIIIYGKEKGKKGRIYTDISEQLIILSNNEPIIESNQFLYVQEKLDMNKLKTTAKKQGKYTWLTGLIKCKDCNHSIGIKLTKGYKYLLCSRHRLYNACTNKTSFKLDEVEDTVYNNICNYIKGLDLEKIENKKVDNSLLIKLNTLNIEKIKEQEKLNNIIEAIANGDKLSDILKDKAIELDNNIKELDKKILNIQTKIDNNNSNINLELYKKSMDLLLNKFNTLTIEDKQSVIKTFVSEILLNKDTLEIKYNL